LDAASITPITATPCSFQTGSNTTSLSAIGPRDTARILQEITVPDKSQTKLFPVAPGSWGGTGVSVTIDKKTVKIEYDCGEGEIGQQLKIDKKGNFTVDGFHQRGTFGPIRIGHEPKKERARYQGTINGKIMKFKVTMIET